MDRKSVEAIMFNEFALDRLRSDDPGSSETGEKKTTEERYEALEERMKRLVTASGKTPSLTVIPARGEMPAITLELDASLHPDHRVLEATWRYIPDPQYRTLPTPLWAQHEEFHFRWITPENEGREDLERMLSLLQLSIDEYEAVVAELVGSFSKELEITNPDGCPTEEQWKVLRMIAAGEREFTVFTNIEGTLTRWIPHVPGESMTHEQFTSAISGTEPNGSAEVFTVRDVGQNEGMALLIFFQHKFPQLSLGF